ncbi:MAG: glycerol-3-phosphate acyltransferase [Rubricoccaceae bacterium]|nr:glycerol-3-phosphate acyltransferase [Rubricoccaceae bacterium]
MLALVFVVLFLVGVGLGAVPFAWLLVRLRHGLNLYAAGSTNVGANNAYRVSGSRLLGALVLVLDLLKGVVAVGVGWAVWAVAATGFGTMPLPPGEAPLRFWCGAVPLLGAVAGHNYNPLLSVMAGRLVGGKGFAMAAGGFLLLTPWVVPSWLGLYAVGRRLFAWRRGLRDPIPGNVFATALIPVVAGALYGGPAALAVGAFALLTLPKHARQMQALLRAGSGDVRGEQESVNGDD